MADPDATQPTPRPRAPLDPGPTPTGYQRTQAGGIKWVPPTPGRLAQLLPQYEIQSILGYGGMGAVYKGVQKALDRPVAIKILPPEIDDEEGSYVERFKNEAKVMARFMHPAIVGVFDFGETVEGQLYIVMEYVDGTDVQKMIQSQGRLPPEHALAITSHVCDALRYAHEHGVIHRDIKPANILINMEGAVKVADFGLAKAEEAGSSGLTKTGMAMGTPDYVAPESLVMGVNVDGRADLYAIGVMLYTMLTGRVPRGAFKPASVVSLEIDPRFDAIVQKAMQMDREERYQSAAEIRQDLDVIMTAPLMQAGGQSSAAIPMAVVAEKPVVKGPQRKPMPTPAAGTQVKAEGAEAKPKSLAWVIPTALSSVVILGGAFFMRGKVADGPVAKTVAVAAPQKVVEVPKPAPVPSPSKPKASASSNPVESVPSKPKAATAAPASAVPASDPKFPPGKWVKVFTKLEELPEQITVSNSKRRAMIKDGWIAPVNRGVQITLPLPASFNQDYAIRARFTGNGVGGQQGIVARMQAVTTSSKLYQLRLFGSELRSHKKESSGDTMIASSRQSSSETSDEFSLEFGVIKSRLIGRCNNGPALLGTDASYSRGQAAVYITDMSVRDLEVINLDGLSEAEALKILGVDEKGNDLRKPAAVASATPAANASPVSADNFPAGQWVKLDGTPSLGPVSVGPEGWIEPMSSFKELELFSGKNQGIRLRSRVSNNTSGDAHMLGVRSKKQEDHNVSRYQVILSSGSGNLSIRRNEGTSATTPILRGLSSLSLQTDEEIQMEFSVVGDRLISRINGQLQPFVTDSKYADGYLAFRNVFPIRDIEVINLDGLPEAEALKILGVDEKGNDLRAAVVAQEQRRMDAAKVVDAASAIPELKVLHEQFVRLKAERVTGPFEAEVAKLNAGYVGGIEREIASEKKAGHLDGVIELEAEKKLVTGGQAVPAEDEAGATEALKKLRGIYRAAYGKIEAVRVEGMKGLTESLSVRLKTLEGELTQKDRVPDAKTVREYREGLAEGAKAVPAAGSAPAATPTSALPVSKYPKGDDRKAAEWALGLGGEGNVTVATAASPALVIGRREDLPAQSFKLIRIDLAFGAASAIPKTDITSLAPMAGLANLAALRLSGSFFTDAMLEILPSLPELTELKLIGTATTEASMEFIKSCKRLKILTVENNKDFPGSRLDELTPLKLNELHLKATGVDGSKLAIIGAWTSLTYLTLWYHDFRDEDMVGLSALSKLEALSLQRTSVSFAGLQHFSKCRQLTMLAFAPPPDEPSPEFTRVVEMFPKLSRYRTEGPCSRAQVAALAAFKNLGNLEINRETATDESVLGALALPKLTALRLIYGGGQNITAAAIQQLAAHKSIEIITCDGMPLLTDEALLALADMRQLKEITLGPAPKLTPGGIAAFKKKRPEVRLDR